VPVLLWLLVLLLVLALTACAGTGAGTGATNLAAPLSTQQIADLLASPDRSETDRRNDQRRLPAQMLAFIGVRPGLLALDLSAGGGYTTELLARAAGPTGKVYGQSAPRIARPAPAAPEGAAAPVAAAAASAPPAGALRPSPVALAARAANPRAGRIVAVVAPFESPVPPDLAPASLDLVTLMFNYHDLGHMGVDRASMNRAVYAGLKPGGLYVIADHAGRAGTGISEAGTLHRIEEAFLRAEVEAAGFRLVESGNFLRNPNDPRDRNTPEPAQPKDEFVLKFVKP
jgi:predicted methyltransferase